MDTETQKNGKNNRAAEKKEKKSASPFHGVTQNLRDALRIRKSDKLAPLTDLFTLAVAMLFANRHLIFGSYPLAIGLLSVLPERVWIALAGAVLGSLFLGRAGVIYAMIAVLVVFLRVVISGGDPTEEEPPAIGGRSGGAPRQRGLFREALPLRVSCAVIGGFVAAVYEVLLNRLTLATAAFGISMVLIPGMLVLAFYGLFDCGITVRDLLFGKRNLFADAGKDAQKTLVLLWFRLSAAVFLFFITYALDRIALFGIQFSYIFAAAATLFLAKRFGALYAAVGGFATTVGLSANFAVSFALSGLAAGLLFPVGQVYALVGGGAALCAWSSYAAGLSGLLSVLPEYLIGAALLFPLLGRLSTEAAPQVAEQICRTATDMVGTMALAYRERKESDFLGFERSLARLSPLVKRFAASEERPSTEEYRALVADCADKLCMTCPGYVGCRSANVRPVERSAERIADKLSRGEPIGKEDLDDAPAFCAMTEQIADGIKHAASLLEGEHGKARRLDLFAEDCDLLADMIAEIRENGERERALNEELSEKLIRVFAEYGFTDGVIRAFGERRPYVLAAGEDATGAAISSPDLQKAFDREANRIFGKPTFYRRGKMAVMETAADRSFETEYAYATLAKGTDERSGDSAGCFVTEDLKFYAVLSDGMGSGEIAGETSEFCISFLQTILGTGVSKAGALRLLNRILRRRYEECGATVDLFEFDLITGEAMFFKSGAAPSYVKRQDSLFRLRSETVPLGLLKKIDAERIRTEVRDGDWILLFSDGVCQNDDAPWLVEFLNRPAKKTPEEYAGAILQAARAAASQTDDMTVLAVRIRKI